MSIRPPRIIILLFTIIILSTLFFLYPSSDDPRNPGDLSRKYEAGGIDSQHYRPAKGPPGSPNYEHEEARWSSSEDCEGDGAECLVPGIRGEQIVQFEKGKYTSGKDTKGSVFGGWFGKGSKDDNNKGNGKGGGGKIDEVSMEQEAGVRVDQEVLHGGVIMPKLGNETAKAELGRASWRLLHLMTLRYPDHPSPTDREALKSYFHLFSRLYPCGECAKEFQSLLKQYPPQTSSRKSASLWLCHVHNLVNIRLGKPEFDCLTLDETYDCGCDPSEESGGKGEEGGKKFNPPEKGSLGGKILGGKGKKPNGEGWKQPQVEKGAEHETVTGTAGGIIDAGGAGGQEPIQPVEYEESIETSGVNKNRDDPKGNDSTSPPLKEISREKQILDMQSLEEEENAED